MTPEKLKEIEEKFLEQMNKYKNSEYMSEFHNQADDLLIEFLNEIGCVKLAKSYDRVNKEYWGNKK